MKKILVWQSSSIIIGTLIGAGILGLPFAFVQAGFMTGLVVLGLLGTAILILSLFFGEITLRTKTTHQLTGYTGLYLGKSAKHIQALLLLFGMFSAMLAYTVGLGEILASILGSSPVLWSIISYAVLSLFVIKGLGLIKRVEFVISFVFFGLLFILAALTSSHMNFPLWPSFNVRNFFIPYGAILFACSGIVSIPEARLLLHAQKEERLLRTVILIGNIFPILIYAAFAAIVVSVTGIHTTEVATIGLSSSVGPLALAIGSTFALAAMSSSFMTLGTAISEVFQFDYNIKHGHALIVTLAVPLLLFIIGIRNFFGIVSTAGALTVGLTGLLTLIVYWRAKKYGTRKPEYSFPNWFAIPATILISLVFICGLLYTL